MHTKRKRLSRNKHRHKRHSSCRGRRAGGLGNLKHLSTLRKGLASSIAKRQFLGPIIDVVNHKGTYNGSDSLFTGTMHKHGKYIRGNLFYYETNGNMVGVRATEFNNSNHPCGTVTRINMDGTPILDNFERPMIENVTCSIRSHVAEHPFEQ